MLQYVKLPQAKQGKRGGDKSLNMTTFVATK